MKDIQIKWAKKGDKMINLKIGQKDCFYKTISEFDIYGFAGISGDLNRFHIDKTYAENTFFKRRIAHGVLLLSFVSTIIGTKMPGEGTILTSISSEFLRPAYIGDTIKAEAEVTEIDDNKIKIGFICRNQKEEILVKGFANVTVPKN